MSQGRMSNHFEPSAGHAQVLDEDEIGNVLQDDYEKRKYTTFQNTSTKRPLPHRAPNMMNLPQSSPLQNWSSAHKSHQQSIEQDPQRPISPFSKAVEYQQQQFRKENEKI